MSPSLALWPTGRAPSTQVGELTVGLDVAGGCLRLGRGGASLRFELAARGTGGDGPVTLRQGGDPAPRLLPLEEGDGRLGLRAQATLYDEAGTVHGEALQDAWVTAEGELFLAVALRLVPPGGHLVVHEAGLEVTLDGFDAVEGEGRSALLGRGAAAAALLAWPAGRGRRFDAIRWQATRPPFYERWPTLFDQWSLDPATYGWERQPGSGAVVEALPGGGHVVRLRWIAADVDARPQLDARALVWCGLGDPVRLRRLLEAHEEPLEPAVEGGRLRTYDELDGCYEVAAGDGPSCAVTFPPDPLERPLRVRVFGLGDGGGYRAEGAVTALLNSERGRTDDPLVWVRVPPEGAADEAVLRATARRDGPVRLALRRAEGLQAAYQRRDPERRLTVHHPADPARPIASLELAGPRLRDLRLPGADRPALHDLPLFWMRYLPKASAHLANRLVAAELRSSGPDEVVVRLESTVPGGRVRSTYELTFPYRPAHVELRLRAELRGAAAWGLRTFEYADLFCEAGIDAARWDFTRLAFVGEAGTRVMDARDPYPGLEDRLALPASALDAFGAAHRLPDAGPWAFGGRAAIVLGGSPRGTLVVVAENGTPGTEHLATLCEHWADVHLDAAVPGQRPEASEQAQRDAGPPPAIPDPLVAELTLTLHHPSALPFADAVEAAQLRFAGAVATTG